MAKRNYKYNNTVDLSNLIYKTKRNYIDWKASIGKIIPFTFNDGKLVGEFTIIDYKIPNDAVHPHVYLEYLGNELKPILPQGLKNATISQILDEYYIEWAYEIGDILKDEKRNIKIINRKREKDYNNYYRKYYQISCLECGFDGNQHFVNGELRNEYWVTENDLTRNDKRRISCPCCSGRIVVTNINDIPTTASWMIPYFQGGYDEAKRYSKGSNVKKYFKCIHCNTVSNKLRKICELYDNNGLTCMCNDHISYPNKFAYYLFKQLKSQYEYYENEYSPDWAGLYRYDNFVIKNGEKYVIEMDGGLGHGNRTFKTNEKDVDGLKRDKEKNIIASNHNIIMIRIDCKESNLNYIKNNIINSQLSVLFNLKNVDWNHIDALSKNKNFYKDICDYYNKTNKFLTEISRDLNLGIKVVRSAISVGNKLGWCKYDSTNKFNEEKFYKLIDYWKDNKYIQTSILAEKFKLGQSTVVSYLKYASDIGLCDYNPKESYEYYLNNKKTYPVYVFDLNMNLLSSYKSSKECEVNSMKDFGVQFKKRCIDYICLGRGKTHKGYYFSRSLIFNKDEMRKYILEDYHHKESVYVYKSDYTYCGLYQSIKELCEKSIDDFGIQFIRSNVSSVCVGRYKQHKGYIFSHTPLFQESLKDSLLLCSNE